MVIAAPQSSARGNYTQLLHSLNAPPTSPQVTQLASVIVEFRFVSGDLVQKSAVLVVCFNLGRKCLDHCNVKSATNLVAN
jgi:hypothetical protein